MLLIVLLGLLYFCCGWTVASRIPLSRRLSDCVAGSLLLGFGGFYLFPVLIGWCTGVMSVPVNVYGSVLFCAVSSLAVAYRCRRSFWTLGAVCGCLLRCSSWLWIVFLGVVGLLLLELMLGMHLTVRVWDALTVHIGPAMEWFASGKFDLTMFGKQGKVVQEAQWLVYPNVKAVFPWLVLEQTGQTMGTALTQWPWQLLLGAMVFASGRRCHASGGFSMLAVLFALAAPEVILQSLDAYCDVVFLASLSCLVWTTLVLAGRVPTLGHVVLALFAWGLVAGSKNNAVLAGAVFGPIVLGILLMNLPSGRKLWGSVLSVVSIIAVCWLVGGSWFMRGIRLFGNPLYPYSVKIGNYELLSGPDVPDATLEFIRKYVGVSPDDSRWYSLMGWNSSPTFADWCGGFGIHFTVFGLAALLMFMGFGLVRSSGARAVNGLRSSGGGCVSQDVCARRLLVLMLVVWYFVCPANMNTRYVLSNLILVSIAVAWVLTHAPVLLRFVLTVGVVISVLFNCFVTFPSYYYRPFSFEKLTYDYLTYDEGTCVEQIYPDTVTPLEVWRLSVAAPGCKIALPDYTKTHWNPWLAFVPKKGVGYCYAALAENRDEQGAVDWCRRLREQGATHLYLPASHPDWQLAKRAPHLFIPVFSTVSSNYGSNGSIYAQWEKPEQGTLFELVKESNHE